MSVRTLDDAKRFFVAVCAAAESDNRLTIGAANHEFVVRLVVINVV